MNTPTDSKAVYERLQECPDFRSAMAYVMESAKRAK